MKLKHIITSLVGLSVVVAATLCHANSVNFVNINDNNKVKKDLSISYMVLSQQGEHSPTPKEFGVTVLKPGAKHTVNFTVHPDERVWVQTIALNGRSDIPNLQEACKLIATKDSAQPGEIGIALIDGSHDLTLKCEVHGGDMK